MNGGSNSWQFSVAILICCALLLGCNNKKSAAKNRVFDAVNGQTIMLTSKDCAVLRLSDGYAGVTITTTNFAAHFRVITSGSGEFARDGVLVAEGVTSYLTNVPVGNIRILLGDGGENETSFRLNFGDYTTGIAVAKGTTLEHVDVQKLSFRANADVDPNDLLKSIGVKP